MATGSELSLAVEAASQMEAKGTAVRVVSMPCLEVFAQQTKEYQESVLPKAVRRRIAVEAASDFGWWKYVGLDGACVTMPGFGASAPAGELFEKYGFSVENVVRTAEELLKV